MSSKRRRNETKKIRDPYPTKTLKELEDEGLIPKNFHLFDRVDMKEYHLKYKTDSNLFIGFENGWLVT